MKDKKRKIIVFSGPSGGGKTTIVKEILKNFPEIVFSVSTTTRPKRKTEKEGIEYFFISEAEFLKKIEKNEFDYVIENLELHKAVSEAKSLVRKILKENK